MKKKVSFSFLKKLRKFSVIKMSVDQCLIPQIERERFRNASFDSIWMFNRSHNGRLF